MSVFDTFEVAAGSVTGRTHLLAGRGNQDAFVVERRASSLVAVVCDGCGSGEHSEVGARLGARAVATRLSSLLERGSGLDDALFEELRADVLRFLGQVAEGQGGALHEVVAESLLFTVVGVALTEEDGCLFGVGDGLVSLNGRTRELGPFENNAPPYLGYGLVDPARGPRFEVHARFPTGELTNALVGTDGVVDLASAALRPVPGGGAPVGPLSQFWEDDRFFSNRDAVRRRLSLVNRELSRPIWNEQRVAREPGLLPDDTTLVVVRRARNGGAPCRFN